MDFPAMKPAELLRVLARKPLSYRAKKTGHTQKGSHRLMESSRGYPRLLWSYHDSGPEIRPRRVKKILVEDVGLTEEEALAAIKGDLK